MRPWFDGETGDLLFDSYVPKRPSYRRVLEDAVVTDEEIDEQVEMVTALFRRLAQSLSPEARELATDALCELAVLNDLQLKRLGLGGTTPFGG